MERQQTRHLPLLHAPPPPQISLDVLWGYLDAVYDLTILYEGQGPQGRRREAPHLFGVCVCVHVCVLGLSCLTTRDNAISAETFVKREDYHVLCMMCNFCA